MKKVKTRKNKTVHRISKEEVNIIVQTRIKLWPWRFCFSVQNYFKPPQNEDNINFFI